MQRTVLILALPLTSSPQTRPFLLKLRFETNATRQLLPQYMNDAGYTSHMIGKWHLGGHTEAHLPHRRGFETHLGYTFGTETYWTHQVGRDQGFRTPHRTVIWQDDRREESSGANNLSVRKECCVICDRRRTPAEGVPCGVGVACPRSATSSSLWPVPPPFVVDGSPAAFCCQQARLFWRRTRRPSQPMLNSKNPSPPDAHVFFM